MPVVGVEVVIKVGVGDVGCSRDGGVVEVPVVGLVIKVGGSGVGCSRDGGGVYVQ